MTDSAGRKKRDEVQSVLQLQRQDIMGDVKMSTYTANTRVSMHRPARLRDKHVLLMDSKVRTTCTPY